MGMERSTSWAKDGHKFETFKDDRKGLRRILVKKDGSPFQILKRESKDTVNWTTIQRRTKN